MSKIYVMFLRALTEAVKNDDLENGEYLKVDELLFLQDEWMKKQAKTLDETIKL